MSRWAHENPEAMSEIASLPYREQAGALRHAIGHDPDLIRDEQKERERCICDADGPDEFGVFDLIESPDCPIHGEAA